MAADAAAGYSADWFRALGEDEIQEPMLCPDQSGDVHWIPANLVTLVADYGERVHLSFRMIATDGATRGEQEHAYHVSLTEGTARWLIDALTWAVENPRPADGGDTIRQAEIDEVDR
jgi:hypothetical protein